MLMPQFCLLKYEPNLIVLQNEILGQSGHDHDVIVNRSVSMTETGGVIDLIEETP